MQMETKREPRKLYLFQREIAFNSKVQKRNKEGYQIMINGSNSSRGYTDHT